MSVLTDFRETTNSRPLTVIFKFLAMAELPSLDQLRGKILGLLQAPATKIAGILQAPAGQLARVVGAYAKKEAA